MLVLPDRKYAPRCSVCGEPIMPEQGQEETVRIVALDRSFHVNCYICEVSQLCLQLNQTGLYNTKYQKHQDLLICYFRGLRVSISVKGFF